MFAFAIWDNTLRKLFLVRDRLGVKPIVFVVRDGTIAFASTVRALRAAGYVSELDPRAILDFLSESDFSNDDRSIYAGAVKVAAASIVEWSKGELSCHRYWTAPAPQEQAWCSFEEAIEETEKRLLESVAIRLHADVPVAAMLSGGIDSGLVCWAIARLGADVTAYTIGIRNDPWDETRAARSTAMKIGIKHCLIRNVRLEPCSAP